ncbi:hypothetical protein ACFSQE_01260 [Vogesella fluminis]|uniref:Uncharacterized protein n=1 Tax=Vogesella fluminis TaxID=1069161 RepID=A0ABQ3HC79_9NEIS|nr:hypothetical protein [Vogesella fluminis]GHD81598.1 hypothetical protein GCM10011419_27860 [Vogesella fluminis]
MPKTCPDLTPKPYRLLKTDLAAKLSARSQGGITYLLLASEDDPALYLAVTANEGGGLWSKEAVGLDAIEEILSHYADQPFPTKTLRGALVGRSSNNPPFLCAVLKDLGLIAKSPDKAHQHVTVGDWQAFRQEWLAAPGETIFYPPVEEGATDAPVTTVVSETADDDLPAKPSKAKRKKVVVADTEEAAPEEDHPSEIDEVSDAATAHAD